MNYNVDRLLRCKYYDITFTLAENRRHEAIIVLSKSSAMRLCLWRKIRLVHFLLQLPSFRWPIRHQAGFRSWLVLGIVAGGLFALDLVVDPQISVIALYGVLIVAARRNIGPHAVIALGLLCAALAIAGHLLTPNSGSEANVVDAAFSLIAIAATTALTLRIDKANRDTCAVQAELAYVSRLLLVDEMNSALAHEVNQPLAAAAANAQAATRWLTASPPNRAEANSALKRSIEAIDFAGMIVQQWRDRARRIVPQHQRLDLRGVIDDAIKLLGGRIIAHGVELSLRIRGPLLICGDRVRLQQVLINLMVNALDAMSDVLRPRVLTIEAYAEGRWIVLRILDVGRGLEPDLVEHLFEPFRTTKPQGLGMGLAISLSIIKAYGGTIQAASHLPHGAAFTLRLPMASCDA